MRLIAAADGGDKRIGSGVCSTRSENSTIILSHVLKYVDQFIYRGTPWVLPEDVREALANFLSVEEVELRHPEVPARKPYGENKPTAPSEPRRRRSQPLAEGFSAVTEIDVRASAGPGAINDGLEESKETWLFPDLVIRHEFRARAADLHIVTIDGDSMEPLLSSGDRILVDTSQRVPVPPGIFVIWDGLGIVAKRIEHIPHSEPPKIVIKSVNPEYRTYERDGDEVNIIGRLSGRRSGCRGERDGGIDGNSR
ncbi:MAG: helix-turn-helix transcriptional regulator [Geminicoccaceae bacterium]